jgi:hypothetical protein
MVNNKERQKYYDETELASRLLREIPRRVSRVRSCSSVARHDKQSGASVHLTFFFLFRSHSSYFCATFGVLLFIFCLNLIIVSTDCLFPWLTK